MFFALLLMLTIAEPKARCIFLKEDSRLASYVEYFTLDFPIYIR